ncbi:MAG: choice-of-anchor C family protein [Acidobacteria bacterium]|nr:choice-of-anchor C family protein [Acidobacteriota bacterium]
MRGRLLRAVFWSVVLLFVLATAASARRLTTLVVSDATTDSPCDPGTEIREFQSTDPRVTVFAIFEDLLAGDRVSILFLRPDGQTYRVSNFEGVPEGGGWCFASSIGLAGQPAAGYPGVWSVGVTVNDMGALDGVPMQTSFTVRANALSNGSFEQPGNFAPTRVVSLGDPFLVGWSVTQGAVDYVGGVWKASDGQYSIDLNGGRSGTIAQAAATVVGQTYTLSFDLAGNPAVAGEKRVRVSAAGQVQDFKFYNNATTTTAAMGWQTRTWTFTAVSAATTISFESLTSGDAGPAIDNVVLSAGGVQPPPTCSYYVSPQSAEVASAGGTGLILVNTTSACAWTAASNASWITIESGASGTGSGTVGYRVAANMTGAARTGTVTVAGQTHTVTQAAGAPCSYTLAPVSAEVPAAGATLSVNILANSASCAWTAVSNVTWISIVSGASGTGSGTVRYAVDANVAETPRNGSLTVAGRSFPVTQAGAPSMSGPTLGGALNAASGLPQTAPGGGLARGSFFSLYGAGIGPETWQQATSFPLPKSMAGVEVFIRQGGSQTACILNFVSSAQINAILPSNAPLGEGEIVVRYQGREAAIAARVVDSAFGVFSLQGGRGPGVVQNFVSQTDTPLNSATASASPAQAVIIWGTGLGPIGEADDMPPPVGDLPVDVEVQIGGKSARILYKGRAPCCAGVDEIVAELAADTPQGCHVPLQVRAGSLWSNVVTIAVDPGRQSCSETTEVPFFGIAADGGRSGAVVLARANIYAALEGSDPLDATLDLGLGLFVEAGSFVGNPLFDMLSAPPPIGACSSLAQTQDLSGLLGSLDLTNPGGSVTGGELPAVGLNAGPALTLTGPGGRMATMETGEDNPGLYLGLLGGQLPLEGFESQPPFLDGGAYSLTGPGGPDVGAFATGFTLAPPIRWLNREQITAIRRGEPITLTWSGGGSNEVVLIAGAASDAATDTVGGFVCFERATAGQFTVPASATANLPSIGPEASLEGAGGLLGLASLPLSDYPTFAAGGLDRGFILASGLSLRTVSVGDGAGPPAATPRITTISPTSARAGQTFTLQVMGDNLDTVTALEMSPSTGVMIGPVNRVVSLSPGGAAQAVRLTAEATLAATASPGVRTVTAVAPTGRSNGATFEVLEPAPPPAAQLRITNFVADARVEGFTGLVLGAGFDFEAPLGNIIWTGNKATSAKLEVSLKSNFNNNECRFVLAGGPLNFPGQTSGSLQVGPVPTFQQDLAVTGQGTVSITLVDPAGNRSNTLSAAVGAEPLCPAGSPAKEFVF